MTWELHYFGDSVFTRDRPTVPTPVALPCNFCRESICAGDRGVVTQTVQISASTASAIPPGSEAIVSVPARALLSVALHIECMYRELMGSVGHQLRQCPCYGGHLDDPPGMSKRESARAAARLAAELSRSGSRRPKAPN